jgi:hypothetical protein
LITGQELIGKFVSETDTSVTIKRPLMLVLGPQGAAFQPFTMTGDSDSEVTVRLETIISVLTTRTDVSTAYGSATSGLVVPEKQGLIL